MRRSWQSLIPALALACVATCAPSVLAAPVDAGNDFVPGDQVLFGDTFERVPAGMLPRSVTVTQGNMEVARVDDRPVLRITSDPTQFSVRLPSTLPERFTIELDVGLPPQLGWDQSILLVAPEASERDARIVHWDEKAGIVDRSGEAQRDYASDVAAAKQGNDDSDEPPPRWDHWQVMGDGNFVKVYVNGTRVANVPNVNLGRSSALYFVMRGDQKYPVMLANLRVAAGGKDLYRALMEDGQATLEGIEFDTGSDVLRPSSDAVLQKAAAALKDRSDVVVIVQGHTDNVGDDAANKALSERRAKSVVARLTALGVAADRLRAEGIGEAQPIASNDTPEGRQRNRRVVLLRDY
ncbi:MAG: OmpA family protein [Steroidobacteraceae bacterium]